MRRGAASGARGARIARRRFVASMCAGLAGTRLPPAFAQAPDRVRRVGFLSLGAPVGGPPRAFTLALRERGWTEGANFRFERRFAERPDDLRRLADELVAARVDVIITSGTPAARAAKEATRTIPVLIQVGEDPVANGLVQSLSRPGGNLTGFHNGGFAGKTLELVKEVRPSAKIVVYPENPGAALIETASRLGLSIRGMAVHGGNKDVAEFVAFVRQTKPDVAVVPGYSWMREIVLGRIIQLLYDLRIPSIGEWPDFARGGGLMSFGQRDAPERIAAKLDRLLRGDNPAETPIELPTLFHLAINVETARALGVTIPRAVRERADEIFE